MKLVLLLALLGCAAALQAPVEYTYKYKCRIGTGIQSSQPQYATTGLKADVKITVQSPSEVTIQLSNVEVGEKNQEVPNNGRQEVPLQYQGIHDKAIEQPFKAYLSKRDGETVMEVPANDLLWVTNVRRSVANMLRVDPIIHPSSIRPVGPSSSVVPQAFSRVEDTYAGRCRVSYTLTEASMYDIKSEPLSDIQSQEARKGPAGDSIKLEDTKYRLQTSLDFSSCSDRVGLFQTGIGNLTNVTSSAYKDVAARSYTTQYILKGSPGKFRIESAQVESYYIFNPYGIDSDKMAVISNQTLVLETSHTVSRYAGRMSGSTKTVQTWRHQLRSPYSAPSGYRPRWVVYNPHGGSYEPVEYERISSGFVPTSQDYSAIEDEIKTQINGAKARLEVQNKDNTESPSDYRGTEDGRVAQSLEYVQTLVRTLPYNQLKTLYDQFKQQCGQCHLLYVDCLATAASGPSVKLLLEKIKAKEITQNRTASIFLNIGNNVQSPEVISELMDYVISIKEQDQVVVSILTKLNFAIMARRLCISPEIRFYSHMTYIFGSSICQKSAVIDKFLPSLESKIKDTSLPAWIRILNVIAVGNLGARESLDILRDVSEGKLGEDKYFRMSALQAMQADKFDNSSRDFIFNIMHPIAESRVEDFRVREVAYHSLLTWKPNATFIQRLALSSLNEPSRQIQSFTSWVIKSLAKMEDPSYRYLSSSARSILAFTQYVNPSMHRSMKDISSHYYTDDLIGASTDFAWLTSFSGRYPSGLYSYITGKFGRFEVPLVESMTMGNTQAAYTTIRETSERISERVKNVHSSREATYRRDHEHRQHVQEQIRQKSEEFGRTSSDESVDIYSYIKMHRTSEVFMPLTNDIYDEISSKLAGMARKLKETEQEVRFSKFFSPVEVSIILPTPTGLFFQTKVLSPTVLYGNLTARLLPLPSIRTSDRIPASGPIRVVTDGLAKAVVKTNTYSQVFAPWTNKTVMAVVDNEKSLSLPLKFELEGQLRLPYQIVWGRITPRFESSSSKVPVFKMRNVPYTAVGGKLPSVVSSKHPVQFKKVRWYSGTEPQNKVVLPLSMDNTGLNAEYVFEGETPVPFSQPNIIQYISNPARLLELLASPSIKNYETTVYHMGSDETKSIGFSVRHLLKQGSSSAPQITVSGSEKQPANVSPKDTLQQRLQLLEQFSNKRNHEYSAQVNFTSSSGVKKYEMSFIYAEDERQPSSSSRDTFYKTQLAFLVDNPRSRAEPRTCFVTVVERPMIAPMTRLLELFKRGGSSKYLTAHLAGTIYEGSSCKSSDSPVFHSQGSFGVSDTRARGIIESSGQPEPPLFNNTEGFYRLAVYDSMRLVGSWTTPSERLRNFTLRVKDLAEGFMFPSIVKNHLARNTEKQISIDVRRSISDDRVEGFVRLPEENALLQEVRVVPVFDWWSGFVADVYDTKYTIQGRKLSLQGPSDACHIKPTFVKTFDTVTYSKKPSTCYQTAIKIKRGRDDILVLTRQESHSETSPQEVKILSALNGLDIILKGSSLKVRGEEMTETTKEIKNEAGTVIAKLVKVPDMSEVKLPGKLRVVLKEQNKLQIKLDRRYRNATAGLCGNFDSETMEDLRDPKGCLYQPSAGAQYAASWVSQKSQCRDQRMEPLFQEARKKQESCPKTHRALSQEPDLCHVYAYRALKIDDKECITDAKHNFCVPNLESEKRCKAIRSHNVTAKFNCWSPDTAPSFVKKALRSGYTFHVPNKHHYPIVETVVQRAFVEETSCIPSSNSITLSNSGPESSNCVVHGYPVISDGPLLCVSEQSMSLCGPNCNTGDTRPAEVKCKCWNRERAPSPVKQGVYQGYVTSSVSTSPEFTSVVVFERPMNCARPPY